MLSHHKVMMSIAAAATAYGAVAVAAATPSYALYEGRWTVGDAKPVFSAKGRFYKTFDVARCGGDVCGVSVTDSGACGPTLFRFHSASLADSGQALGHGRWGTAKKKLMISGWSDNEMPGGRRLKINLGDGYDFGERSGNMPKYSAEYRPTGKAGCHAR